MGDMQTMTYIIHFSSRYCPAKDIGENRLTVLAGDNHNTLPHLILCSVFFVDFYDRLMRLLFAYSCQHSSNRGEVDI